MSQLCACGCGLPTSLPRGTDKTRGWVKGQPLRYIYTHRVQKPTPLSEILWPRVDVRGPDECWPWMGRITPGGYGKINQGFVHRLVLAEKLGRPLAPDEVTRHTCDNRPCCNPSHLIPGSHADNLQDARDRNRLRHAVKLTDDQFAEIRRLYATGAYRQIDIATMFGTAQAYVSAIVRHKTRR